jgi:ABC-type proline/glycine betaine transport system permease subunit
MLKQGWGFLILLGTLLGASAMFNVMYNEPLTDYSIAGITAYTSILYGLSDSIWSSIINLISNVLMPIVDLIQVVIDVFSQIFAWLSNGLGNLIAFFGGN